MLRKKGFNNLEQKIDLISLLLGVILLQKTGLSTPLIMFKVSLGVIILILFD
jgi:hypothetical protein